MAEYATWEEIKYGAPSINIQQPNFRQQLEGYRQCREEMARAGVVFPEPRFRIPAEDRARMFYPEKRK